MKLKASKYCDILQNINKNLKIHLSTVDSH